MSSNVINVRKGVHIELISIIWMIIETGVAILSGIMAHSLSLVVFGADSMIELVAGIVLLWRLMIEVKGASLERVKRAETTSSWVVGIALILLAIYIVVAAIHALWTRQGAESSPMGIGLAVISALLMIYLSKAKKRIGEEIGSKALKVDGSCSIVCAYMAIIVLIGAVLTSIFGWWWMDSIISFGLAFFVVREGMEGIQEARGVEDT